MAEGKILVVEDEPAVAEVLAYNLRRRGYEALTAENGLAACRLIGNEKPDLIILDLMLPDLDGREICRLVRGLSDENLASTPILMLTALASANDRVRGLSLGADDYVAKPFDLDEILLRAGKLVERRKIETAATADIVAAESREALWGELQNMLFHELRNQLLVVGGFANRLNTNADGVEPDKIRSYAHAIHQSAQHLQGLAEELLLLRRIEHSELELPAGLALPGEIVKATVELFAPVAEERRISVHADVEEGLPPLRINESIARILLSCLVDNAVKYGREGGAVRIAFRKEDPDGLLLSVEDDGIGIPGGDLKRVFEKFFRGERASKTTRGTGLGLYFVKRLVDSAGGRISLESTFGKGTRFEVHLPS